MTDEEAFTELLAALINWAQNHMDQWDRFKFKTTFGTVYVSISMEAEYPSSFEAVIVGQP